IDRYASVAELLRDLQAPVALGESLLLRRPVGANAAGANGAPPPIPATAAQGAAPRPALGDAATTGWRDPALSPYGLPWRVEAPRTGLLAFVVGQLFRVIEAVIFVALLPVRIVSSLSGRGALFVLQLPFRILGAAARLVGYLVVAAVLVLIVVGVLSVVARM